MADHERLRASSDVSSSSRASLSGGSSRRAPRDPKFRPNLIRCDVHPPARSAGVWDAHLVFKVDCTSRLRDYVTTCRVELIAGHTAHFSVQRRFADFVWLRRRLRELYPGAILPALPSPKAAEGPESITVDLEGEFARRVVARLKTFLERLCDHPLVYNSPALLCFFTEGNGEAFRAARAGAPA